MPDRNGFKRINDLFGHRMGDQTLIVVGQRLLLAVRDSDLVARLEGDEFAIVATQLPSSESATSLAPRILGGLSPSCRRRQRRAPDRRRHWYPPDSRRRRHSGRSAAPRRFRSLQG
jgi:GGDEF domain-containing protein